MLRLNALSRGEQMTKVMKGGNRREGPSKKRRNSAWAARLKGGTPIKPLIPTQAKQGLCGPPAIYDIASSCRGIGGPGRDRTDDLFHAMEARSQLRHRPTSAGEFIVPHRTPLVKPRRDNADCIRVTYKLLWIRAADSQVCHACREGRCRRLVGTSGGQCGAGADSGTRRPFSGWQLWRFKAASRRSFRIEDRLGAGISRLLRNGRQSVRAFALRRRQAQAVI